MKNLSHWRARRLVQICAFTALIPPAVAIASPAPARVGPMASPKVQMATAPSALQCGEINGNVWLRNAGDTPVPAGALVYWQVPQRVVPTSWGDFTEAALGGVFKLQQVLNPGATLDMIKVPPAEGPSPNIDPASQAAVGGLIAALSPRPCTVRLATMADLARQRQPIHVATANPGTPTAVSVARADPNTVNLAWTGGVATAHFYVFETTTASSPPADYHSWHNSAIVPGAVLKAAVSVPRATTPQSNYFMVCAANAGSTLVSCSQPIRENGVLPVRQRTVLLRPR